METPAPSRAKEALRSISVFFYAMAGGMLMFAIIVFSLNLLEKPSLEDESMTNIFLIVVLFVAMISLTVAVRMYPERIAAAHATGLSLMDKLNIYRGALMLYLALCEGAGLFAIIVYFLTGNKLLLAVVTIVLVAMLLKRPEKSKIFNELQLSSEEQMELN
jgi:hypothetical protein